MYDTARRVAFVKQRVRENNRRRQRREVISLSAAAVVITALCFRLRSKENRRKDGTDKPNRHEKEEKSQ